MTSGSACIPFLTTIATRNFRQPTEHVDLGTDPKYAKIVDQMIERMEELQPSVYDPDRGKPEVAAACAKLEENGGFWSPWKDVKDRE